MSAVAIRQMADRVEALLAERLKLRGRGLAGKLKQARGALPKHIRAELALLAQAQQQAQNPKLLQQIDYGRVAEAYDACLQHLTAIGRGKRRRVAAINLLGSIAFRLLAVAGLVFAVLIWRGYVR